MEAKQATFQTPRPEVKIYSPDSDKPKLEFDTSHKTVLQAYNFKTSVNDEKGQFSLTFYPDDDKPDNEGPIFDRIHELDIVKIYESRNHFKQYRIDQGRTLVQEVLPTFTGVVRRKKYVSQVSGTSVSPEADNIRSFHCGACRRIPHEYGFKRPGDNGGNGSTG
jgi:hypothetical protein